MKKIISILVAVSLVFSMTLTSFAITKSDAYTKIAKKYEDNAGDWIIYGMGLGGYDVKASTIKSFKANISVKNPTDYARTVLALSAVGQDASKYVDKLLDYDFIKSQGMNGPVWALMALDFYGVKDKVEDRYVDYLLGIEKKDGGFNFSSSAEKYDVDMTAMVLCALYPFRNDEKVKKVCDRALDLLKDCKSFSSYGAVNAESAAQVAFAFKKWGVKEDKAINQLMEFYTPVGFKHIKDGNIDGLATVQGFYALGMYLEGGAEKAKIKSVTKKDGKITCKVRTTYVRVDGKRVKASGYTLMLAKDKKFTKGKKSVSAKKLTISTKSKALYAKVKPYVLVDGKKVYGKVSAVKKVK
ncbi:MAG: terpene cyclase/mutase family protein [Clostridia bacterium]|nr:terpene cyclase/mutase family protein [Clostridia bacterium]